MVDKKKGGIIVSAPMDKTTPIRGHSPSEAFHSQSRALPDALAYRLVLRGPSSRGDVGGAHPARFGGSRLLRGIQRPCPADRRFGRRNGRDRRRAFGRMGDVSLFRQARPPRRPTGLWRRAGARFFPPWNFRAAPPRPLPSPPGCGNALWPRRPRRLVPRIEGLLSAGPARAAGPSVTFRRRADQPLHPHRAQRLECHRSSPPAPVR